MCLCVFNLSVSQREVREEEESGGQREFVTNWKRKKEARGYLHERFQSDGIIGAVVVVVVIIVRTAHDADAKKKGSFTRTKTRDQLTSALARVSLLLVGCALFSFARNGETLNYKIRKKERHVVFVFQNDTPALLLFSRSRRQTDDDEGNRESEREE